MGVFSIKAGPENHQTKNQMELAELLNDKGKKPKEKTEILSNWILGGAISMNSLIDFADKAKDPVKATCIEALEFATKQNPDAANLEAFEFVSQNLASKAPRIKWESAKVVGNTARLFLNKLDVAVKNLLINSEHEGTVVRWSAAFALGEILKLKTNLNTELLPAIEAICLREEKESIRKIYLAAIKKASK